MSNTERLAFMRKSNPRIYSQLEDIGQKATALPLFSRLGRKNWLLVRTKPLAATAVNHVAFLLKRSTVELSNMYWLVKYVAGMLLNRVCYWWKPHRRQYRRKTSNCWPQHITDTRGLDRCTDRHAKLALGNGVQRVFMYPLYSTMQTGPSCTRPFVK